MIYFLNLFFVASIFGFFLEQGLLLLLHKKYNSSLLKGPWTIVYGVASLVILYIGKIVSNLKINKFLKFLCFCILTFLVTSILEFIAGISIEKILGIVYWDYSNIPLNFGRYVCVPVSLIWTIYGCILNYLIYPWLKKLLPKIPKWITVILIILFISDIIYSIWEYLHYV